MVAAVNQDNLDFAIANGARPEFSTIFRYGNLIDKRHIAPPESRELSGAVLKEFWDEPRRFLLHIGRLQSLKFPEDPIKVLAEVRRRGHDVKLLMVGDGVERGALVALAREIGIESDVVFSGNRDQDWLARVIPLAAAVLSPLTGRALSEAAFGAAPIVAYDLDWQGELIRTGETGELVPFRLIEKMADAVESFLVNALYARKMGDAARKRAFEILDPETLDRHEREKYTELFLRFRSIG
jgi:glycosyltransferase involved in cell wall biosynthesis